MFLAKTPIYCDKCGTFIGYIEDFSMSVLPSTNDGIKCCKCGKIILNSTIYCTSQTNLTYENIVNNIQILQNFGISFK